MKKKAQKKKAKGKGEVPAAVTRAVSAVVQAIETATGKIRTAYIALVQAFSETPLRTVKGNDGRQVFRPAADPQSIIKPKKKAHKAILAMVQEKYPTRYDSYKTLLTRVAREAGVPIERKDSTGKGKGKRKKKKKADPTPTAPADILKDGMAIENLIAALLTNGRIDRQEVMQGIGKGIRKGLKAAGYHHITCTAENGKDKATQLFKVA